MGPPDSLRPVEAVGEFLDFDDAGSEVEEHVVIGIEFRSTLGIQFKATGSTTLAFGDDADAGGQGCVPWTISPGFGRPIGKG